MPKVRDENVRAVRRALRQRAALGFRKYGTTTAGSEVGVLQWLQHLQEELLDAAVYVETLKTRISKKGKP